VSKKSVPGPRVRKVLAHEQKKLQELAAPVETAYAAAQDAQLAFNSTKAEFDVVNTKFQRYGAFLVKKYRLKKDEEIDTDSGVIRKTPPKPPEEAQ
jgi:hypothetical protein